MVGNSSRSSCRRCATSSALMRSSDLRRNIPTKSRRSCGKPSLVLHSRVRCQHSATHPACECASWRLKNADSQHSSKSRRRVARRCGMRARTTAAHSPSVPHRRPGTAPRASCRARAEAARAPSSTPLAAPHGCTRCTRRAPTRRCVQGARTCTAQWHTPLPRRAAARAALARRRRACGGARNCRSGRGAARAAAPSSAPAPSRPRAPTNRSAGSAQRVGRVAAR